MTLPVLLGSPGILGNFQIQGITISPGSPDTAGTNANYVVSSAAATPLPTVSLANRAQVIIYNLDAAITIWVAVKNTVAVGTGQAVLAGGYISFAVGPDIVIYARAESGAPNVNVQEVS